MMGVWFLEWLIVNKILDILTPTGQRHGDNTFHILFSKKVQGLRLGIDSVYMKYYL